MKVPDVAEELSVFCYPAFYKSADVPIGRAVTIIAITLLTESDILSVLKNVLGVPGFWAMMVFLGVLTVGFIYEWRKGALEWD